MTHLTGRKLKAEEKRPNPSDHYNNANRASLALFYDKDISYVGSGVLVSASYVLTVKSVVDKISHPIELAQIIFEINRGIGPYYVEHRVDINESTDLVLALVCMCILT